MADREILVRLDEDDLAFIERMAAQDGYVDARDCLQGILKNALLHHRMRPEENAEHRIIETLRTEKLVLQETIVSMVVRATERSLPLCDGSCTSSTSSAFDSDFDDIPF